MIVLRSIVTAFSMFSRLPMPKVAWRQENMRYMLGAFPLIGLAIGLFIWGWIGICRWLGIGTILFAAGLVLIPVAATGGIHLDGFSDTLDALASHAEPARKREILKDPHAGAFAIIGVGSYLLLYGALASELPVKAKTAGLLILMHVLSRVLSGLSIMFLPTSSVQGLAFTFKESSARKWTIAVLLAMGALGAAGLIAVDWLSGGVMLLAALFSLFYLVWLSKKQFGGMSGDLAGFFLQVAELAMLAAIVSIQLIRSSGVTGL